jgi:signal transduction histidine kinase
MSNTAAQLSSAYVKETDLVKRDSIASITHDIRTPLNSIKLILECATSGVYGELNNTGCVMMNNAQRASDYLIHLISNFLDAEACEAGGMVLNIEQTNGRRLIDEAISFVAPNAQKKRIVICCNCDQFELNADEDRLKRVLINLLGNAIKFSPTDSKIDVEIVMQSGFAQVSIKDEGPGIPLEKQELVFERYYRLETRSAGEKTGNGLGLAICKLLVEAHGGQIGLRSVGKGCDFWFRVPRL